MESIWDGVVAIILPIWFGASVFHQSFSLWGGRPLVRSDFYGLLPNWSFFAPNPAYKDNHVVYRNKINGKWSEWISLTSNSNKVHWRWFWNPNRLIRKATNDLVNGLIRNSEKFDHASRSIILSNSYIALLHWVVAQQRNREMTHRQFAIVTSTGFSPERTIDMLFLSETHRLDP